MKTPFNVHPTAGRRHFLQQAVMGGASAFGLALPLAGLAATPGRVDEGFSPGGRLVVVFLRGAYDGLSAFVPYSDPNYYRLRPTIAIPAPGTGEGAAIALDASFALHPALANLYPLWQQGVLAFVPAAGSPSDTRSHFEAQNHWEIGDPDKSNAPGGWMNTLAKLLAVNPQQASAIGVGEANPKILSGPAKVQLVPRGLAATRTGVLADDKTRAKLLAMYVGQDTLATAFQSGVESRMETATALDAQSMQQEMMAADNGARDAKALEQDAIHLNTLMSRNRHLRLGFLSAGGWDSHTNQGSSNGQLANNLGQLGGALLRLRRDFSLPGDTVAVVSEFGRTTRENGSRGTDHGHGNALWLMGDRVNGGRWHGQWRGLAESQLHQGRDLPVFHDFRDIFGQVLATQFGLPKEQIASLFPGTRATAGLAGLMKA